MSDGEVYAWFIFGLLGLVCAIGLAWPRKRRKSNRRIIHVPRETLWGRTNRYHEDRS
jgi:hypothetical protein